MKAQLKFPIFSFNPKNKFVYVCWREQDYNTTNINWFKKQKRRKNIVVDSEGMKYVVKQVNMIKWKGIHGFIGLQCGIIEIENEYEDNPVKISLKELQDIVIDRYPKSQAFRSEFWKDVNEFKDTVLQCKTFEELAEVFRCRPSKNIFLRIWRGY